MMTARDRLPPIPEAELADPAARAGTCSSPTVVRRRGSQPTRRARSVTLATSPEVLIFAEPDRDRPG